MTQEHPITPPPELIKDWYDEWNESDQTTHFAHTHIAIRAAQWGADQELKACCDCILSAHSDPAVTGDTVLVDKRVFVKQLRAARRPKPKSLKEQALQELDKVDILWATEEFGQETLKSVDTIRKALEALPDD